jgi:hypothetical protein
MHDSDTTLKALPEIAHQYRAQETRAPVVVSTLFTVAVFLPLVVFVGKAFSAGDLEHVGCECARCVREVPSPSPPSPARAALPVALHRGGCRVVFFFPLLQKRQWACPLIDCACALSCACPCPSPPPPTPPLLSPPPPTCARTPAVGFVWVAGFHGSLAFLLGLIALYWLNLTFFTALSYMVLPAVAAVFFGHKALASLHAVRSVKDKTD